jgi:hypothetical protein
MRKLIVAASAVCFALVLTVGTNIAQEKDEKKSVTLKGKITCAKCDLGTAKACETVIVVKDEKSKKDVIYIFDKASHTKFHEDICTSPKNGAVEGTVKDEAKKKIITVTKVTYE